MWARCKTCTCPPTRWQPSPTLLRRYESNCDIFKAWPGLCNRWPLQPLIMTISHTSTQHLSTSDSCSLCVGVPLLLLLLLLLR